MNHQIVTLEKSATAKYKLIWYKRDSEILNQTDRVKSYKIQLFFENGKSVKDYTVLPINISNVDLYIKENVDLF